MDEYIVEKSFSMDHQSRSLSGGILGKEDNCVLGPVPKYLSGVTETQDWKMQFLSNANSLVPGLLCDVPATRGRLDEPFRLID